MIIIRKNFKISDNLKFILKLLNGMKRVHYQIKLLLYFKLKSAFRIIYI